MARFLFSTKTIGNDTLYATDGTAAGTTPVNLPGFQTFGSSGGGSPDFTTFNGSDYFLGVGFASRSPSETRIYSSDGTVGGTPGTEITGFGGVASPVGLWVVNGHLLTSGQTAGGVPGLWSSTDGGTFSEIRIGYGTSKISVSHGVGFFATDLNTGSSGVWRTDGTLAGTQQVTANPDLERPSNFLQVANGNTIFFDNGLWVTDGASNTYEIINGTLGSYVEAGGAASTGTKAIFAALDANGLESAWSTDGTGPGTVELLTNPPSDRSPVPSGFTTLGSKVVFSSGFALYVTDGTVAGTVNLSGVNVDAFAVAGSNVFFTDYRSPSGIFVSDGTAAGTRQITVPGLQSSNSVASITAVGSSVVFEGMDGSGKAALFSSDGTIAGTGELVLPAGVVPSTASVFAALPAPATASGIVTLPGGAQNYAAAVGTTVQAGTGSDTISASAGQVTVLGSSGHLVFFGGAGSSIVRGGSGSDTVFGGAGGGQFSGGAAGHNILIAQGGNTTLTGATGGDQLFGSSAGNDVLNLGSGRELALGGGGNTTINGGAGSSVVFTGGGSTSVVGGSAGSDTVVGGSGVLRVTAQHGDAIFGGSGALGVDGSAVGSHADSIIGGAGALTVVGHGANMLVVGGATASNIFTGDGASLIFSGSGSTSVTGGAGSMQVVLGTGGGTFREGTGPSVYDAVKGAAAGLDVITGFRPGADTVALYGYAHGDVQVVRSGGSTVLNLAGGAKIELLGVADPGRSVVGA